METQKNNRILVTGATGYIGGRLVARLLAVGYQVRALGRSMDKLNSRSWSTHPRLETVQADLLDPSVIDVYTQDCQAGYYLIPSHNPLGKDFSVDYRIARNIALAAEKSGWRQLVFLKGLTRNKNLSNPYLISRWKIESILRSFNTPVTAFHTDIVYGCGSVTYEIIRSLSRRFHLISIQPWMNIRCKPIALPDLIEYLSICLRCPEMIGQSFDISGPEWTTYREMMTIFNQEAGLNKRHFIPLPVPTTRLSAYWIHMLTPIPANPAYMLIANIKRYIGNRETNISDSIPLALLDIRTAMRKFVQISNEQAVETHWTDAGVTPPVDWLPESSVQGGNRKLYRDKREITLDASRENIWQSLARIGGKTGWYYGNTLWKIRGFLDRIMGGVGLDRGRRHSEELRPGDALDLWRARVVDPPSRLMLVAEMKLPGKAILDFQILPAENNQVKIKQTAWYEAHGILGIMYWYSVLPFHAFIFQGMIEGIAKATRLSFRYSFQEPARIKLGEQTFEGQFLNISRGGCKVFSPRPASRSQLMEIWVPRKKALMTAVSLIGQYPALDGYYISFKFLSPGPVFRNWLEETLQIVGGEEPVTST